MISALGVPSKKSSPEQQIASMRNYINQFRQDYEDENYNITWEKLAKPLKEKIEGLDKELVAQGENFNYLSANMVSVGYLEANYLTASQIQASYIATNQLDTALLNSYYLNSVYVYAGSIDAGQINAGTISAQYLDSSVITTDNLSAQNISGGQITSGTVAANRISSAIMRTNDFTAANISAKYNSADVTAFEYMNCNHLQPWDSGYNRRVVATFQQVTISGHTYRLLGWQVN